MMTVDILLKEILECPQEYAKSRISKRDFNTLVSLSNAIDRPAFITENQANLLVKILKENYKKIENFSETIILTIAEPIWSKKFRYIEQIKKLKILPRYDQDPCLLIELSFNTTIRKTIHNVSKSLEGFIPNLNGKEYHVDLTEKNIIILVDTLMPFDFEIDEKILDHYSVIKSWSEETVKNQFLITNFDNKNFQKHITDDLGINTAIDNNIINDRSIRYQYFPENAKNFGENLTEVIANRSKSRVFIDKKIHELSDIFESLKLLRRLPVLVVFENWDEQKALKNLEILDKSLEKSGTNNEVGIYFRLPNSEIGRKFNQLIADQQYNKPLDHHTNIAVVQSGKIPKFFLKNDWQPMSVIALDTKMGLRHGKTSVYSNCCDLIIEWSETPSILDQRLIL